MHESIGNAPVWGKAAALHFTSEFPHVLLRAHDLQQQFLSSLKLGLTSLLCWECEPAAKCWGSKDTLSKDIKRKTFLAIKTRATIPLRRTRNVRLECLLSLG